MGPIAWGITGAGHFLTECGDVLAELAEVDLFLSRAAEEVVRMYGAQQHLEQSARYV